MAPAEPFLKLSKENPRPENNLQRQLSEILKDKLAQEKSAWEEMYAVGQQMGFFIAGKQLLRKLPYSAGYKVQRYANEDADTQRAQNLTQFYVWCNVSKILRSNPDILVRPGEDSDEALNASIAGGAVSDHYEPRFFSPEWSTREALLLLQYGNDIVRLRWSPSAKGPLVAQNITEARQVTFGEGIGWCADCNSPNLPSTKQVGPRPSADFVPPGIDPSALGGAGICPDCGGSAVLVKHPPTTTMNVVTGQQQVRMGDFVLDHLPLPACRWDLYKRPEDSTWFDYAQRIPLGALRLLIGDFQFPESDGQDKGLDVLHSLAYAGLTSSGGGSQDAYKRDIFRHTADMHETNLSPEDYVGVKIKAGTKTVSGHELPEGKMTDLYPDGAIMLSLGKGDLLLGLWPEKHSDFLTSSAWFQQADSGAGRGMVDSIEVQKRYNASDGQIFNYLASSSTPAWLYDPNVVKPSHMGYIGKPRTNIPVNLSMIPNLDITKAIKALEPGSVAGQYVDYSSKHLTNMFQVTSLVLDFSDYLPIDNRTATGAQIASALANSLVGPQLASKAGCHKRVIEMLIEQYPTRFPVQRYFPLSGKRGKRPGIYLMGTDLTHSVVCEVVPDSELPVSPFIKQQDFTNWLQGLGGPQGYSYMKVSEPELLQQSLGVFHIKLDLETFDAAEMRCRARLDQMVKALEGGVNDPSVLMQQIQPPISEYELLQDEKALWWAEWLDDDESCEPNMMPMRQVAEQLIQIHFENFGQQEAIKAGASGAAQAAGAAPVAVGQHMLDRHAAAHDASLQPQEQPDQQEQPQSPQDHIAESMGYPDLPPDAQKAMLKQAGLPSTGVDAVHEANVKQKVTAMQGANAVRVAKARPKPSASILRRKPAGKK